MRTQFFVLAINLSSRGYAFVLFEGPESPFDWGIKAVRRIKKNSRIVDGIAALIAHYHPRVVVMENFTEATSRRAMRVRKLYRALVDLAKTESIEVRLYARTVVKRCFSSVGGTTKYEIAQAVARHIPAFKHRLPPLRKTWMSEDPRQALFDAAALGLTFYALAEDEARE